jgi:outer membrane protein assembly factor BamE (lipoprotein component of BamABCDE complex)
MKRRTDRMIPRIALALALGLTAAGCTTSEEIQRGYLLDENALSQVKPGMDAQQVLNILGSPSTVSTVGNRSWYYISQKTVRRAQFMGERVVDQRVTAVYFNQNLRVERVALYGIQDGKIFDFISRTTPTGGSEQSFLTQLFRGIGSFNPFGV